MTNVGAIVDGSCGYMEQIKRTEDEIRRRALNNLLVSQSDASHVTGAMEKIHTAITDNIGSVCTKLCTGEDSCFLVGAENNLDPLYDIVHPSAEQVLVLRAREEYRELLAIEKLGKS